MDLVRLLLQPLGIILELPRLHHLHAALDAALKGPLLVFAEIVPGAGAQQTIDLRQSVARLFRVERAPIADVSDDPLGISSTESSRSTNPAATALEGISVKRGRETFVPWATVSPPFSLIALMPSVPS